MTAFGQKVKPRTKPKPKPSVLEPTPDFYKCVESTTIINSGATSLPEPVYPEAARVARAGGVIKLQVLIDEEGNVARAPLRQGPFFFGQRPFSQKSKVLSDCGGGPKCDDQTGLSFRDPR